MSQDYENIFVGISIRNKTLTAKQVEEIVLRAQIDFNARRLLFLIADGLELINLRVFDTGTADTLQRQVDRQCAELQETIEGGITAVSTTRLHVVTDRWQSILNAEYWSSYISVFSRFMENNLFRSQIVAIAQRFAKRRGETPTPEQLHYLSQYLIGEIPTLIKGVRYRQRRYQTMIYPVRGDEAIDQIAHELASGQFGQVSNLVQTCRIIRMEA